ncbi:MAG: maleylpyruvate isomerase N-terminal domain-containing protein [Nakamurella sp.]
MDTFPSWIAVRSAFEHAARWFVSTVVAERGRWDEPGLGEWSVRDLIGHTSRALLTVESYLDKNATAIDIGSPGGYFRAALASMGDPAAVARRGRDAGIALGPEIDAAVVEISERVLARVNSEQPDAVVATPVGGMRLVDYLPTRTFELTVHTCDLAVALGRPLDVPSVAAVESLTVLGELAAHAGNAGPLLLAVTGRRALPAGFTVL